MNVSHSIALSVSSILLLGMIGLTTSQALAQSDSGGEIRLKATIVSGAASDKGEYRERDDHRRLNVQAEDLPNTTPSP